MNAYIRQVTRRYVEHGETSFVSQKYFRGVWMKFIKLQNWGYNYQCPWCKRDGEPHTANEILFDGVAITLKKKQCPHLKTPKQPFQDNVTVGNRKMVTDTARFLQKSQYKDDFFNYVTTKFGVYKRQAYKTTELSEEGMEEFEDIISEDNHYKLFVDCVKKAEAIMKSAALSKRLLAFFCVFVWYFF